MLIDCVISIPFLFQSAFCLDVEAKSFISGSVHNKAAVSYLRLPHLCNLNQWTSGNFHLLLDCTVR